MARRHRPADPSPPLAPSGRIGWRKPRGLRLRQWRETWRTGHSLGQPVPKGGGRYVTGAAYRVDGVWYQPREDPTYDQVGTASWYGELFHGRRTANGEIYDMDRLSAASPTLPMPVYARVTNLENRRSIIVRVNDRGPYRSDRIIDLSRRSAEVLGFRRQGHGAGARSISCSRAAQWRRQLRATLSGKPRLGAIRLAGEGDDAGCRRQHCREHAAAAAETVACDGFRRSAGAAASCAGRGAAAPLAGEHPPTGWPIAPRAIGRRRPISYSGRLLQERG